MSPDTSFHLALLGLVLSAVGLGLFLRWCLRIAREDRERAHALRAERAVFVRDEAWETFGNPGVPSVRGRVHDGEAPQAVPEQ